MKKFIILALCFFIVQTALVTAQETAPEESEQTEQYIETYTMGDQTFTLAGGTIAPLFIMDSNGSMKDMNLNWGLSGSLGWASYLDNNVKLGFDLNGFLNWDLNSYSFVMVTPMFKATYEFRSYPLRIPVSLGLGLNYMTYGSLNNIGPAVNPEVGFYFNTGTAWSVGLKVSYLWFADIYFGGTIPASATSFGNMLTISLAGLYNL